MINKLKKAFCNLYFVITRFLLGVGIMLWFAICVFGWVIPIALQNYGYGNSLQLIAFVGWLLLTAVGVYSLAKVAKINW